MNESVADGPHKVDVLRHGWLVDDFYAIADPHLPRAEARMRVIAEAKTRRRRRDGM